MIITSLHVILGILSPCSLNSLAHAFLPVGPHRLQSPDPEVLPAAVGAGGDVSAL